MATIKCHSLHSPFFAQIFQELSTSKLRKRNVSIKKAKLSDPNVKRANLSARKKERVKLPTCEGNEKSYHISNFFSHPSGIEAMLNTRALQDYQSLDSNLYRCVLPQLQLLSFVVEPVIDLQVTPTAEDCIVEMLSCKFEGSELVERQNKHFSAFMRNHIKWGTIGSETFLDVDVNLNLALEIYTQPFKLLPVSAVEVPGNVMMQALVDRLVPLLVQQLLQDYEEWVRQQHKTLL